MEEGSTKGRDGLVHIYTGEGKGKTTASVGLAVRAAGSGKRVLFVQFFKPEDDFSGEKDVFENFIERIEVMRDSVRHPFFTGSSTDHEKVGQSVRELFGAAMARMKEGFDMVVLDEVISAVGAGYIESSELLDFVEKASHDGVEVVLTGRDAPMELVKAADYVTEMLKIKHPFDEGVKARKGVEF